MISLDLDYFPLNNQLKIFFKKRFLELGLAPYVISNTPRKQNTEIK